MAVAVVAVSFSGPVMAGLVVPALAIAFWRNGMATVLLAPAAWRRGGELRSLGREQFGWIGLSGLALALHFATWVTSLTMTSVASATALVTLQMAFVAAWNLLNGERFSRLMTVGMVVAFAGVLVVTGVDFSLSTRALVGDLLAFVGGAAAAAYTVLGSRARRSVSTTTYTFVCYGTCASILLVACLASGQALVGYGAREWLLLGVVTLTAQMLGHSVLNHLLATTTPMTVSLVLLLEVPGAALLAAALLGQVPPFATFVGLAVILLGMVLVIFNARPTALAEPAPT